MKTCLGCGKSHRKEIPKKCRFQMAMFRALARVLRPHEATYLCDKTTLLSDTWKEFNRIKKEGAK